jgi:hypothetical protein
VARTENSALSAEVDENRQPGERRHPQHAFAGPGSLARASLAREGLLEGFEELLNQVLERYRIRVHMELSLPDEMALDEKHGDQPVTGSRRRAC